MIDSQAISFTPPRGTTFFSPLLAAPELSKALCSIVVMLQDIEPRGTRLQKYEDWLEHDGLHFHHGSISIHELFQIVKSPRCLIDAMHSDENVFIGIAPNSNEWYLRFYLAWDDEGFELNGRFDISLPDKFSHLLQSELFDLFQLRKEEAVAYFQRIRV